MRLAIRVMHAPPVGLAAAPTGPALRVFGGTSVLRPVGGAPVPVLRLDSSDARQYLAADTLTADGQGRDTRVHVIRVDSGARAYSTT